MYKKLLFIIYTFMLGCVAGGFDVTQPLIKATPEPNDTYFEGISWKEYVDSEFKAYNGCFLFYFKEPLNCDECEALDRSFQNNMVISLLDQYFITYMVTSDDVDWEKAKLRFNINSIPAILIIGGPELSIVKINYGYLDANGLNNIILDAIGDRCYHD